MTRPRHPEIVGHVDHAGGGLIRGWAADLRSPSRRLALDVFRYGVFLGCARAGGLREDLRAQGIGDGFYGFVFHSPGLAGLRAADGLRVVSSDAAGTPLVIAGASPTSAPEHAPAAAFRDLLVPLIGDIDARHVGASAQLPSLGSAAARRLDILLAPDGASGSSAFTAHIAVKYGRPPAADDPADFWHWYLETYGVEQRGRTPLSSDDLAGIARVRSRPDSNAHSRRFGSRRRASSAFAWAIHDARRLAIEDCLVDESTIAALSNIPWRSRWTAFPLSDFMRQARQRHALLWTIPVGTAAGRMTLYAVLMLLALREVHYLRYMPSVWVDRLLEGAPGTSRFEGRQHALLGASAHVLPPSTYRAQIESMGFELSSRQFSTRRRGDHRLCLARQAGDRQAGDGDPVDRPVVDVQMIGPFRQSLGLAESCRRVAHAIQASGLGVAFVDYRIGSLSRPVQPDVDVGAARVARINILHLNAEEVPEAMVYCAGALVDRHTILIPYWELDRPSAVHRLGLELVDEVWCASRFLASVFAGARPTMHIGMSYDDRFQPPERRPHRTFTVLTISDASSWTQRKNVLGAIDAFQAAFDDREARLVVKTRNARAALNAAQTADWRQIMARCEADPRIVLLDTQLPPAEQHALLAEADCLLSLHRAEGLGLDILDALHVGTPVVATAYSGNMDVCNAQTAWVIDYDLVPVEPEGYAFVEPGHVWAEPTLASAVAALRAVRGDAAARLRKVAAAQAFVKAHASPEAFAARLSRLLRERLEGMPAAALETAAAPTL